MKLVPARQDTTVHAVRIVSIFIYLFISIVLLLHETKIYKVFFLKLVILLLLACYSHINCTGILCVSLDTL